MTVKVQIRVCFVAVKDSYCEASLAMMEGHEMGVGWHAGENPSLSKGRDQLFGIPEVVVNHEYLGLGGLDLQAEKVVGFGAY